MPQKFNVEALDPAFRFHPFPWPGDPIPDWIIRFLDRAVIVQLAQVQMQLTQEMLSAQLKAVKATQEILAKVRK